MNVKCQCVEKYIELVAYYSDKHAVFPISQAETHQTSAQVLHEMTIELICANISMAKGCVEQGNKTLQDWLVKSMQLENVSSIESANH